MNQNRQKKSSSGLAIVFLVIAALMALADSNLEETVDIILGFAVLLLPLAVVFFVIRAVVRQKKRTTHTHDRIDHSRDLEINPATGRAAPVRTVQPHGAREHWIEQLDTLLANGTITRSEYQTMRNRKF